MSNLKGPLPLLFSVIVIDLIGFGIVVPILPFYAVQYGANATILGLVLTSYSAMQFLFSGPWGRLSDRIGRRPVILITLVGTSFSLILLGMARSIPWLFAGRILSGIFAANVSVASAYVVDVTSEADRSRGMGLIGAAFGVGFILGPAIGGLLAPFGYHLPILAAGGLAAINCVYASLSLREPERHHQIEEKMKPSSWSQGAILKPCLVWFVFSVGVSQLEATFALFMMDRFHSDAMHVSYLLAAMAVIMVAIQGGAIRALTNRFGEKNLLLAGSLILAASFVLIPFPTRILLLAVPLLFASVGRGFFQPSLMSLVSKRAEPARRGSVMGRLQSSASLGRVVGPLAAGLLYDQSITYPYYLAAGLMVVVLVVSWEI